MEIKVMSNPWNLGWAATNSSYVRDRLFLDDLLWASTVQHLEEIWRLRPHTRMDKCLRALDVIMKVIPEHVDEVDRVVPCLATSVPGKQDCKTHIWKSRWVRIETNGIKKYHSFPGIC
jgi:hypothetical protein